MIFSKIVLVFIVAFLGFSISEVIADDKLDENTDMQRLQINSQTMTELRQDAVITGILPTDSLIERLETHRLLTNSDNIQENSFQYAQDYAEHVHAKNGWNESMITSHIAIHNFDTLIENPGNSHEIVALGISKMKLEDKYSPSEPEKKFHDWIITKYSVPHTVDKIDYRLLEIIDDKEFLMFINDLLYHFNNLANHGNVPSDLFYNNPEYWMGIANISMCEYNSNCDVNALKNIVYNKDSAVSFDVETFTQTDVFHILTASVKSDRCQNYDNCEFKDSVSGIGLLDMILEPRHPDDYSIHVDSPARMIFKASSCSDNSPNALNQVTVIPRLGHEDRTDSAQSTSGLGCAYAYTGGIADSDWILGVHATSTGALNDVDIVIPSWIKNNAGWWADNAINDSEFVQGIQYLIKNDVLKIPQTTQGASSGSNEIPDWIKSNAGWWAEGLIDDRTFVRAIQHLIEEGIITLQINSFAEIQNLSESYEQLQITTLSNESLTPIPGSNTQGCEPNCYSSTILLVDTGSTITFSNNIDSANTFTSGNPHTGPDGTWDSKLLQSGQSYSVTLDTPGTYQYYSQVHPWMQGSVIVGATSTNLPPTANAGNDKTADEQTTVVLSGTGTDPENQGQLRYTWQQTAGEQVSLSGSNFAGGISNSQVTSFTAPDVSQPTTLTFQLTVRDDTLQAYTDSITVTINPVTNNVNNPPTANAGEDTTYNEGATVTLDGSDSSDPDSGDTITYLWQQLQGPSVSFDGTIQSPTFTAPDVAAGSINLQFKLLVKDSANVPSAPDYVTITVSDAPSLPDNHPPSTRTDLARTLGVAPVIIDVLFNDSDADGDTITIHSIDTTDTVGTATNNVDTITFTADESFSGTTTFTYTIIDSHGAVSESAQVTVDVFVQQDSGDALWVKNHPDFVANNHFGQSVDFLSNGNILVGAPDHSTYGSVTVLSGNDGAELFTITNPQSTPDDFGHSVSSLNNGIIVGAPLYDVDSNFDAGAVYVYDTSGTLAFPVIQNPEPSSYDKFGISVTASDSTNRIFVGAPSHDVITLNLAEQGTITQTFDGFVVSSDSITQSAITDLNLIANTTANTIRVVDYSTGDTIHEIAHYASYNPETLLFTNILDAFALSDGITPTDDDADFADVDIIPPTLTLNHTANEMSLIDNTTGNVLVSSEIPETQDDLILFYNELTDTSYVYDGTTGVLVLTEFGSAGAVYVYNGTTGAHITPPMYNPNPASFDLFGTSIHTMSNGNVVIGVPGDDSNGSSSGSAYIFNGTIKSQLFYIINPSVGGGASDDFGTAVGTAGNHVIIGAPDDSGYNNAGPSRSGAIYIYDGTTGTQKAYLPAATHAAGVGSSDDFGESVAGSADGTTILGGSIDSEYVLVFSFDGTSATLTQKIESPDGTASRDFGHSITASEDGSNIAVGDPLHAPFFSGAVFFYDVASSANSNTAPTAASDTITVQEDSINNVISVLHNDSDSDGDNISIDSVNLSGTHGTAVLSENSDTILFTPTPDYFGTTTLSYRITDGNGGFSVSTVTVTVTNVNDSPVSENDYITTFEEQTVTIAVLNNDSDIDGNDLTVHSVDNTNTAGTVTNNGDTITFAPSENYNGDTTFTYVTTDGNGGTSQPSSVLIVVEPINDAPVAVNDGTTTLEDTPVTIPVLDNDSDIDVITSEAQAARSLFAFDTHGNNISLPQISGTTNDDGTFVAYSDNDILSEVKSMISLSADDNYNDDSAKEKSQAKESIKDIKSQIKQQRDHIKQLKQEKNDAKDNVKLQKDILTEIKQDFKTAKKQHKQGTITDETFDGVKADLAAQRITLQDAKNDLKDAKDTLKDARDDIKISKGIKNILKGKVSDLDSRLAKIVSSNDVIPVSIKTFANYTNTMTPQDIGVPSHITQSDGTISAILDESQIELLSQSGFVSSITLPHLSEVSSVSQGVSSSYAGLFHNESVTGNGVTVAVIDDSFVLTDTKLSVASVTHSALYDSVGFCGGALSCGKTQGNSHGTATAGIILDMAPDVNLQLYTITSSADFVNAINNIISRGDADIISISLGFPTLGGDGTTGYFRDGTSTVAKAVNDAKNAGILVTVAAGNEAKRHWTGTYDGTSTISPDTIGLTGYHSVMEFQPGTTGLYNVCLPVSHGGWTVLSWDSWEYTNLDYDVFLYDGTMSNILSYSATAQSEVAGEPLEVIYDSPISDACLVVALSEESAPQDSLLHINTVRGSVNDNFTMVQSSVSTPADAAGAVTVGAVNYVDNIPELFSSAGPTDDGRDKPELCGYDGVSTTQGSFSPFLGTSAAAPHMAGAMSLLLQAYPNNSTSQITSTILASAIPSDGTLCGAGILSLQDISVGTNVNGTGGGNGNNGNGTGTGGGGDGDTNTEGGGEPPIVTVGADSIIVQSITTPPAHGTAKIVSDGTAISYTPNSNYHGIDSFEYGIVDNSGETDTATVSLDVTSVNDAPFVTPIIDYTIDPQTSLFFTAVAVDADSADTLTFSLSDNPAGSTIDGITGAFSWTPDNSQTGSHTFDVVVTDDGVSTPSESTTYALSDSESLTVTVSDTIPPVITLLGENPQSIELGAGYTELGATTDDGSDITINSTAFTDAIGSYSILYDSTDSAGNTAIQVSRTVNVVDTTPTEAEAPVWDAQQLYWQTIPTGTNTMTSGSLTITGSANFAEKFGGMGVQGGISNTLDSGESLTFSFDSPIGMIKLDSSYRRGESGNSYQITGYDGTGAEIASVDLPRFAGKNLVEELGVDKVSEIKLTILNESTQTNVSNVLARNYMIIPQYATVEDGLTGKWSFDGGVISSSVGANPAHQMYGDASIVDNGIMGKSLRLDGTGDMVQINHDTSYDMGAGSFTLSSWFSFDETPSSDQWMMLHGTPDDSFEPASNSGSFTGWGLGYDKYAGLIGVYGDGDNYELMSCNPNYFWYSCDNAFDGNMHHMAMVVDKYEPANYFWYDGDLISWSPWSFSVGDTDNSQDLEIGGTGQAGLPANYFAGYIDQIRVYDRVLSYADLNVLSSENDAATFSSLSVNADDTNNNNDGYSGMISFSDDGNNNNSFALDLETLRNTQLATLSDVSLSTGQYRVGDLSIAESTSAIVAGAPKHDGDGIALNTGSAFVFDGMTGDGLYSFENPNPNPADGFGAAVATTDGAMYVIGAPGYDYTENFAADAGIVYVYDAAGELLHTIHNPTPQSGEMFGMSLSIADGKITVDCPRCDVVSNEDGIVYTFEISELDWSGPL